MADNLKRKCLKCGISPQDSPNIKLFRFPKPGSTNMRRCEMWAKYCFPDKQWSLVDFQQKLYSEHRMLCNKHFKDTEFLDFENKKLFKHAVPDVNEFEKGIEAQPIDCPPIIQLCHAHEQVMSHAHVKHQTASTIVPVPGPSCVLMDITNKQYRKHQTASTPESVAGPSRELTDITNKDYQKHQTASTPESVPGPSRESMDIIKKDYEKDVSVVKTDKTVQKSADKILYKKCRNQLKKICYLQNKVKKMKRKDVLNVLDENESVQCLMKKLTPSFALMLQAQLRNIKRKHTGRRWTSEEKFIALRLYKRSATCYRLLQKLWCLPAPSTLKSLLSKFSLETGINDKIFAGLKKHVQSQTPSDNEYVLMFDEMAIRKHLWYNSKSDKIVGYQDHGSQGTTQQEASYALVFMVAGIRKKNKQPVAFYLSGANVTSDRLAVLLKEVLSKCFEIGMNISATVCDMAGVNTRSLTVLGASKNKPSFNINNKEVVAIFDSPHLLKCFRNLFLKYNLKCTTNITSGTIKGQGIAKWSHIQEFYDLDNTNASFVFAPTLRKDHLNPNTKQKMKVNLAAQVLSHSVAAGMYAKISGGELTVDATTTAEVISNVDKLFDCVNSDTADLRRGKPHSTNMTATSPHLKHFDLMLSFFESIEFVGCRSSPPSKDGWIWTINGIIKIYSNLKEKHGIRSLSTRRLQQDPLENLFGCIRANCGANTNPTASQFIGGLKTAIISNLAHIGSGNNCEVDNYHSIMNNYKEMFCSQEPDTVVGDNLPESINEDAQHLSDMLSSVDFSFHESLSDPAELQACAYVCGFIIKKLRVSCILCNTLLKANMKENIHLFLEYKEYVDFKNKLIYSSKDLILCVQDCATLCNKLLLELSSKKNLKITITKIINDRINFSFLYKCEEHAQNNAKFITNSVFHICIKRFCTLKNREYVEAASKLSLKKKIETLKHK